MENERSNLLLGFLLGAAAGAVAGFLMAGGRKEDLTEGLKTAAENIKDELGKQFQKGEELIDELTRSTGELFDEPSQQP